MKSRVNKRAKKRCQSGIDKKMAYGGRNPEMIRSSQSGLINQVQNTQETVQIDHTSSEMPIESYPANNPYTDATTTKDNFLFLKAS